MQTLQSFTEYMKAYNGPEMHGNHRKVWMDLTKDRPMPQVCGWHLFVVSIFVLTFGVGEEELDKNSLSYFFT